MEITVHNHHHQIVEMSSKSKLKKEFSLETYLTFLHSRYLQNLTVDHLNKIVSIHGFKKLSNRKKAEEVVTAITEPIHPSRSTLNDNISTTSNKSLVTLTEAIKDLKDLKWQECSVTSIRVISSKKCSALVNIPAEAAAAKLMALKGNKRARLPTPRATSMTSNGSGPSKSRGSLKGNKRGRSPLATSMTSNGSEPSKSCGPLEGNKRPRLPTLLATSMTSTGSGPSKSGSSDSGGCLSSSTVGEGGGGGAMRKPRKKMISVRKLHSAHAVTALAATASSN